MSKRSLTAEERAAWEAETKRDKKHRAALRVSAVEDEKNTVPVRVRVAPVAAPPPVRVVTPPEKTPAPASRRTARKLTRGDIDIEATLDLHGLTQDAAHGLLHRRMVQWLAQGVRVVCIITGKGRGGEGALKREVPRWLNEPACRRHISTLHPAPQRLGGDGALLVFLKKNR